MKSARSIGRTLVPFALVVLGVVAWLALAVTVGAQITSDRPPVTYVMGVDYAALPAGCITPNVGGGTYYLCGNTWFQPSYGTNGLFYKVVPTP